MPARPPRLKQRREFRRVAEKGRRAARPGLVLQALPAPDRPLRVGFTTTKKIGNAVVRNRARRRLREAARLLLAGSGIEGFELVLIGRDATATRDFAALVGDLRGALRQAGVQPAEQPAEAAP
ncbi:ribonuclease P protein component [Roseomonas sp. AR75]|uniref:ribonuclease P protein component n=1 Tax=Roseomonas sp. AR75 TaxID=2562311 RepID=UPI0010C00BC9|nr:ribonuclease P protein component [Roseomonas sp. AR75]